jgi:hypothetical protein
VQVEERVSGAGTGGSIWCRYRRKYPGAGKGGSTWSMLRRKYLVQGKEGVSGACTEIKIAEKISRKIILIRKDRS